MKGINISRAAVEAFHIIFPAAELSVGGSGLVLFIFLLLEWPADNDHIHLPPGRVTPMCLQPESQYENHS